MPRTWWSRVAFLAVRATASAPEIIVRLQPSTGSLQPPLLAPFVRRRGRGCGAHAGTAGGFVAVAAALVGVLVYSPGDGDGPREPPPAPAVSGGAGGALAGAGGAGAVAEPARCDRRAIRHCRLQGQGAGAAALPGRRAVRGVLGRAAGDGAHAGFDAFAIGSVASVATAQPGVLRRKARSERVSFPVLTDSRGSVSRAYNVLPRAVRKARSARTFVLGGSRQADSAACGRHRCAAAARRAGARTRQGAGGWLVSTEARTTDWRSPARQAVRARPANLAAASCDPHLRSGGHVR